MSISLRKRFAAIALGAACMTTAAVAHADLVFLQNVQNVLGGVGNSQTLLSLQSPGNSTSATGSVGVGGCTGDTAGGCNSANQGFPLLTLGAAGIANASDLIIYFDAQEPGSDLLITLTDLTVNIFGPSGNDALLFSGSYTGPDLDLAVCTGQGQNCVSAFGLDLPQALLLQSLFAPDLRVGLVASLSNATGGPDRFSLGVRSDGGLPPSEIPIPAAGWLLGSGLLAMGAIGRRRLSARV